MEIIYEDTLIETFEFLNKTATKLSLIDCDLSEIPDLDEYSFKEINLSYNELRKIPKLPSCIEVLNLSFNNLIGKINLSQYKSLRVLRINDNKLQAFPKLPEGIKIIDARFNYFKIIDNIPESTEKLLISYNLNLVSCNISKSLLDIWNLYCPKLQMNIPNGVWENGIRKLVKPSKVMYKQCKENECLISYKPFNQKSEYLTCEKCNVEYLYKEITKWLSENDECPHCRQKWTFKDFLYINHG
jgi:hypothetical protein